MYEWKITSIEAPDGELITEAKYYVSLTENDKTVDSEGNWRFKEPKLKVPFDQVTEELVIEWIKQEATENEKNTIEFRIAEQMSEIQTKRDVVAPWMPQVYTPKI